MVEFWSIKDLANQVDMSVSTVRRKIKDGELPGPDVGDMNSRGMKRWINTSVYSFLEKRKQLREKHMSRAI